MHASRSATAGRVLDRPSDHDTVEQEHQVLFGTVHVAKVEPAHATVDRELVSGHVGRIEWIEAAPSANLLSFSWKVGGEGGGGSSSQGVGEDGEGSASGDGR